MERLNAPRLNNWASQVVVKQTLRSNSAKMNGRDMGYLRPKLLSRNCLGLLSSLTTAESTADAQYFDKKTDHAEVDRMVRKDFEPDRRF